MLKGELAKDKLGITLGSFGYQIGQAGFLTYLMFFWTDTMLIPAASISVIMLVSKIIDAFTDVITGSLIDKTKTRFGKIRPWLLWMIVPGTLAVATLWYVPNLAVQGRVIYAFVTYNLVALFWLTCLQIPINALVSVLTTDLDQRLKISQLFGFASTFSAALVNLFASKIMALLGGGALGYSRYFTAVAILGALLIYLCFRLTTERIERPQFSKIPFRVSVKSITRNKYWWFITLAQMMQYYTIASWSATAYYCIYWMGNKINPGLIMAIMTGAMALGVPLAAPFSRKYGKAKVAFLGFSIQLLGDVILFAFPTSVTAIVLFALGQAFGGSGFTVAQNAMRSDVVDYNEWKDGLRPEGLVFSGVSFGTKVGSGLGTAVIGMILSVGDYMAGAATQTAQAMGAIKTAFILNPFFGSSMIMLFLFFFLGLEKQMPQISRELKERRAKMQQTST